MILEERAREMFRKFLDSVLRSLSSDPMKPIDQLALAKKLSATLGKPDRNVSSDLSNIKTGISIGDEKWQQLSVALEQLIKSEIKNPEVANSLNGFLIEIRTGKESKYSASMTRQSEEVIDDQELIREMFTASKIANKINENISAEFKNLKSLHAIYDENFAGLKVLQDELWKKVEELCKEEGINPFRPTLGGKVQLPDRFSSTETSKANEVSFVAADQTGFNFRRVISWERAQTTPTICLIPMFLTGDRKFSWGVIRYGRHEKLGVVLRKECLDIENRDDQNLELLPNKWFEIIRTARKGVKNIFNINPYSAGTIVCQMLLNSQKRKDFPELLAEFTEKYQPPLVDIDEACAKMDESGMLLYDLSLDNGIRHKFKDRREQYTFIKLRHGVDIPAGIGFSLSILDWIMPHYATLKETALKIVGSAESKKRLEQIGVTVLDVS